MDLLIVTKDEAWGREMAARAAEGGLEAQVSGTAAQGLTAAGAEPPHCVIFEGDEDGPELAEFRTGLHTRCPDRAVPVLPAAPGDGAVLDRALEVVGGEKTPEPTRPPRDPSERSALIIEDREPLRRRLAAQLSNDGWTVYEAADGKMGALILIDEIIDCLIVSSVIQGTTSEGIIRGAIQIRKAHPHPYAILVVTDTDDSRVAKTMMEVGVDDVLGRSLGFSVVARRLQIALRHRDLIRENRRLKELIASRLPSPAASN